ncbi:MAG: sugar nucleotide-binding protein [Planctomycetaceae bacterium]
MDKLLIAGVDTVPGANLAAWLAQRFQVVGLSWNGPLAIAECETAVCDPAALDAPRTWIAAERPQWVVYCGPGALSTWDIPVHPAPRPDAVPTAGAWARAAAEFGCELTVVSSDAIFTGPWMFHREASTCFCESHRARLLRLIEKEVVDLYPETLLIRTNVFGWSPAHERPSLIETVLNAVQQGGALALDCMRHATPILATDLADLLERAYQQKLRGVYHLGGSERISPFRFACLLANEFGYSMSSLAAIESTDDSRHGFGSGETSLQTRRIRKALESPLPLVREGLSRLHEQDASGYRDRFGAPVHLAAEQVA